MPPAAGGDSPSTRTRSRRTNRARSASRRAESGGAFAVYGVSQQTPQALYLVRPDGYVAWRADRLDLPTPATFLRERFC